MACCPVDGPARISLRPAVDPGGVVDGLVLDDACGVEGERLHVAPQTSRIAAAIDRFGIAGEEMLDVAVEPVSGGGARSSRAPARGTRSAAGDRRTDDEQGGQLRHEPFDEAVDEALRVCHRSRDYHFPAQSNTVLPRLSVPACHTTTSLLMRRGQHSNVARLAPGQGDPMVHGGTPATRMPAVRLRRGPAGPPGGWYPGPVSANRWPSPHLRLD